MPSRRRRSSRYPASRDPYYDAPRYRRGRRRGCLTDIQEFLTNVLTTIVLIAITGFVLFFTIFHFSQVVALVSALVSFVSLLITILPFVLHYGLYIGGALLGLAVLFWFISLLSSISERHAIASATRAHAEQERLRAEQQRVQVEQQRVKLERDRQAAIDAHERQRAVALAQSAKAASQQQQPPRATRLLPDDPDAAPVLRRHGYVASGSAPPPPSQQQSSPLSTPQQSIPGMPPMPRVQKVRYRDVAPSVPAGQMPALVRADGSLLLTTWKKGYKLTLIVGSSSSGKTITAAGKIHGFVESTGGRILPCDPHETKDDSLFNIIAPLAPALFVNASGQQATFAVTEHDILANMRLARHELELREAGADASVPILLIVEEFNKLMRNKLFAKEMKEILVILGQEARGYNVFCLINCQTVKYLADVRESFISYIVQRVTHESDASSIIPDRFAKFAPELRTGQCFYKDAEGQTTAGLQVFYTMQDMQALAARLVSRSPRPSQQQQAPRSPQTHAFHGARTEQLAGAPPQQAPHAPRRTEPIQQPAGPVDRRQYGSNRLHRTRVVPQTNTQPAVAPVAPPAVVPPLPALAPLSAAEQEQARIAAATWQYEELVPEYPDQQAKGPITEDFRQTTPPPQAAPHVAPAHEQSLSHSGIFNFLAAERDNKKKKL